MPSNPDRDPRRGRGRNWRIHNTRPAGDSRRPRRDRDASPPVSPSEDIRQLSHGEERDLHFNGDPRYDTLPLHELCSPGGCQYKTEAENWADLEAWFLQHDLAPGKEDPEAEL
jgi:hypothetical protein